MNKTEYIKRLAQTLEPYEIPNKYEIMADYEQIVDEILLDNENDFNMVIEKLGYPEILAMEIADELGYKIKYKESQSTNPRQDTYNKKRYKSNIVWNIILVFFYIIQTSFAIALVAIISLLIYFGVDSTINLKVTEKPNYDTQLVVNICRNKKCNTYRSSFNSEIQYSYRDDDDNDTHYSRANSDGKDYVSQGDFPIGVLFLVGSGVLSILLWLNYIIVYKNTRHVIQRNDEYNRRRNYD